MPSNRRHQSTLFYFLNKLVLNRNCQSCYFLALFSMLLPVDYPQPTLYIFRNHVLPLGHKRVSELSCTVLYAALWVITFKPADLSYYILFDR